MLKTANRRRILYALKEASYKQPRVPFLANEWHFNM